MHPQRTYRFAGRSQPYARLETQSRFPRQRETLGNATNYMPEPESGYGWDDPYNRTGFATNYGHEDDQNQSYERGYFSIAPYTETEDPDDQEQYSEQEVHYAPEIAARREDFRSEEWKYEPRRDFHPRPMNNENQHVEKTPFKPKVPQAMIQNLKIHEERKRNAPTVYRPPVEERPRKAVVPQASTEAFQMKRREGLMRVFTGPVDKVLLWANIKDTGPLMFEVVGSLHDVRSGSIPSEKHLAIRDTPTGPTLQVVFYEMDKKLPNLTPGSFVKCIGTLLNRNKLQAYKVTESSFEEKMALQHLTFICNRVAQELVSKK